MEDDDMGGAPQAPPPSRMSTSFHVPGTPASSMGFVQTSLSEAAAPGSSSRRGSLVSMSQPMGMTMVESLGTSAFNPGRRSSIGAPVVPSRRSSFAPALATAEPSLDFRSLFMNTASTLGSIWDELGVNHQDRAIELQRLNESIASVFAARISAEEARRGQLISDIQSMINNCINLQRSMEMPEGMPSKPSEMPLLTYADQIDSTRRHLQAAWDKNASDLRGLEAALFSLHTDIGEPVSPAFHGVGERVSERRMSEYRGEIERAQEVKNDRTAIITGLCEEILSMWNEMAMGPVQGDMVDGCIPSLGAGLGWSSSIITTLQTKAGHLRVEKEAREVRIQTLGAEITTLWKRLATPESEQTAFLEGHAGLGDDVMAAIESYLTTKRAEFGARLVDLIGNTRHAIESLWNEMRAGPVARTTMFPPFFVSAPLTDELYLAHEEYVSTLNAKIETIRPLLRGIEKRDELLRDKAEYEIIIQDPARLTKGSSAARLREEKLERRVKKELPAVTKKLRTQIQEWEAASGSRLIIDDAPYLDVLDAEEMAEDKKKEEHRAAIRGGVATSAGSGGGGAGGPVSGGMGGTMSSTSAPSRPTSALATKDGNKVAPSVIIANAKAKLAATSKPPSMMMDTASSTAPPAAPPSVVGAFQISEASKAAAARMMQQLSQ